jgi:hypothetical protein
MPYFLTAKIRSSNPTNVVSNPISPNPTNVVSNPISPNPTEVVSGGHFILQISFTVLVLVISFFTSVAGVVALFQTKGDTCPKMCRKGVGTAVLVLQCIASFLSGVVYIIGFKGKFIKPDRELNVTHIKTLRIKITSDTPRINAIAIGITLFIVNDICLAEAILIFYDQTHYGNCGVDRYLGPYNGFAILGSFILVLLTSFPIRKEEDVQHRQNSRAGTVHTHWMQTQQKQRRQNTVPN